MGIKYKIDDAKKNKNLINDEIKLSRVKSKGGPGGDGGRKPGSKNRMTLDKLAKIVTDGFAEQAKFNKSVMQRFDEQSKFNESIREDLNRVIKLNNLKH